MKLKCNKLNLQYVYPYFTHAHPVRNNKFYSEINSL